jgi:hypothetical protein
VAGDQDLPPLRRRVHAPRRHVALGRPLRRRRRAEGLSGEPARAIDGICQPPTGQPLGGDRRGRAEQQKEELSHATAAHGEALALHPSCEDRVMAGIDVHILPPSSEDRAQGLIPEHLAKRSLHYLLAHPLPIRRNSAM